MVGRYTKQAEMGRFMDKCETARSRKHGEWGNYVGREKQTRMNNKKHDSVSNNVIIYLY